MKKLFLVVIVFFSFLFSSFTKNSNNNCRRDTLTEENVYYALIVSGIKYPVVVLCQIILETGHLTSDKCRYLNNLTGMTVPKYRKTTCISATGGYARYSSWYESILDYKYYQDNILSENKIHNDLEYINCLRGYAKSKNYKKKLISMEKNYAKKLSLIDSNIL
jgi:flagellum-specific peptidoglycan hydrolase FlgJ